MEEESRFVENSIAHGLEFNEFSKLPNPLIRKLKKMMSRIAERSYRRGVQQAAMFFVEKEGKAVLYPDQGSLHDWRYNTSLDRSPGIDGFETTSLERLETECHVFSDIGFFERKK